MNIHILPSSITNKESKTTAKQEDKSNVLQSNIKLEDETSSKEISLEYNGYECDHSSKNNTHVSDKNLPVDQSTKQLKVNKNYGKGMYHMYILLDLVMHAEIFSWVLRESKYERNKSVIYLFSFEKVSNIYILLN